MQSVPCPIKKGNKLNGHSGNWLCSFCVQNVKSCKPGGTGNVYPCISHQLSSQLPNLLDVIEQVNHLCWTSPSRLEQNCAMNVSKVYFPYILLINVYYLLAMVSAFALMSFSIFFIDGSFRSTIQQCKTILCHMHAAILMEHVKILVNGKGHTKILCIKWPSYDRKVTADVIYSTKSQSSLKTF